MDNAFGDAATDLLDNSSVYDANGDFVMGREDGVYNRKHGLGYSPQCKYTTVACSTEQHPIDWTGGGGPGNGNTAIEEWAELFMNYNAGTFANNAAGTARLMWTYSTLSNLLLPNPPPY